MKTIQNIGAGLFIVALLIFTYMLGIGHQKLTPENIGIDNSYHKEAILEAASDLGIVNEPTSNVAFIPKLSKAIKTAATKLDEQAAKGLPEGVGEWDYKLGYWKNSEYLDSVVKASAGGPVQENPWLFFLLTFGLAILGGLLFILPKFKALPGIKNDGIYHDSLTRGLKYNQKMIFLIPTIIGVLVLGFFKMQDHFWPLATLVLMAVISALVFFKPPTKDRKPAKNSSPINTGWLGIIAGIYLVGFYILLYWAPAYINNWITMVSPISESLSGGAASQWFLYGLMYSIIVCVMGIRMMTKYQHNKYQKIRTLSVMFFQTAFAFLIPEILVRLNQPWYDFKNIWPLDYDFFFKYNIDNLMNSGGLGIFMLVWGIMLIIIGIPLITYFFGKRWYCSWVCGCGGLAETMGDPFRQLSDKSLRAWKYERYIIHGVLAMAIIMTAMVLMHYFTGRNTILGLELEPVKKWYGFIIGAGFSGVVGTGFYPLMGNRVWCRFGCPLAAYLGLVQKFQSRFRITTNGGQCISCGNCSTYCEMGIDVRAYAQKGQDIVRSSCVGCGICSAVCPRGVLKLENSSADIGTRAVAERTIHITEDQIQLLS
jgi:Pyruvate/2-oxoacid:ferredoxin oxidoreductase delta subunit